LSVLLPHFLRNLLSPAIVTGLLVFSVVAFVATLLGVPWFFSHIPADYYARGERVSLPFVPPGSPWRPVVRVAKNVLGVILIALGILMLVLPGQGLLTLVVGLLLVDFPGKRGFEHWLISRRPIRNGINHLRERAHQPPLEV
jgi:hypothetical protein